MERKQSSFAYRVARRRFQCCCFGDQRFCTDSGGLAGAIVSPRGACPVYVCVKLIFHVWSVQLRQ